VRLESAPLQGVAHDSIPSLLHHVAQAAHCAAQGKVGSGFDISAAFFGSQKYRRFNPSILAAVVEVDAIMMFILCTDAVFCSSLPTLILKIRRRLTEPYYFTLQMLQGPSWDMASLAHELILPYASDANADRRLNQVVERFFLPPGFDMLLGDVSGTRPFPAFASPC